MSSLETFDAVVVGGGPAGATAAGDLAKMGHKVKSPFGAHDLAEE